MAAVALTAAQIGVVYSERAVIFDVIANVALTKGQCVYMLTGGKVGLADANAAGLEQARGIALHAVGAGQALSILKEGHCYGFTVSGLNVGIPIFQADTPGQLDTVASVTKTVAVATVVALPDKDLTKVLYVSCRWRDDW